MPINRRNRSIVTLLAVTALVAALLGIAPADAAVPTGTATVQGTITYADGTTPAVGAIVTLCAPPVNAPPSGYRCSVGGLTSQFTTVAGGAYSFPGVAGGTYQLAVTAPPAPTDPYAVLVIGSTFPVTDATTATVNLSLAQGGKVTGRAYGTDGLALASTSISICGSGEPPSFCDSVMTAPDGSYISSRAVAGATAQVRFGIVPPGVFASSFTVTLIPNTTVTAPDLRLDPGGTINGTVLDDLGAPVVNAQVLVQVNGAFGGFTSTGVGGVFSLRAPSGPQTVRVTPPATAPTLAATTVGVTVPTNGSTAVTITLVRGATITSVASAVNGPLSTFTFPFVCPLGTTFSTTAPQCIAANGAPTPALGTINYSTGTVTGLPAGNFQMAGVTGNGSSGWSSPTIALNVAAGDAIVCTYVIDVGQPGGGPGGSTSCTGATGPPPPGGNTATLPPTIGGGTVTIASPPGTSLGSVAAVDPALTGKPLPALTTLPFGAFSFTVSGVAIGGTADVTLTYPVTTPAPNGYAKFVGGAWVDASTLIVSQAPGTVTIRLTDGGAGDADGTPNGVIVDPGGPSSHRYTSTGFDAPIDNLPAINSGQAGRTYPVKFSLADISGAPVTDPAVVTFIRYQPLSCTSLTALGAPVDAAGTGATQLRMTGGKFHVNWSTPRTAGCYELQVGVADGSRLNAQFQLR